MEKKIHDYKKTRKKIHEKQYTEKSRFEDFLKKILWRSIFAFLEKPMSLICDNFGLIECILMRSIGFPR